MDNSFRLIPHNSPQNSIIWTENLLMGSKGTNNLPKQAEFCHRFRYWYLWGPYLICLKDQ